MLGSTSFSSSAISVRPGGLVTVGLSLAETELLLAAFGKKYNCTFTLSETELLTESLSRVRGIVMPVIEHETFNINWGRIRHEAFTVAQTEGVGAAIVRLRGLAEAITEVTGQSYTINLHHDPYDLKVTVSWTEWGEVQKTTPSVLMPIKGGAVCIMD